MVHSPFFTYIQSRYKVGAFTLDQMKILVSLGRITEDERKEIMGEV